MHRGAPAGAKRRGSRRGPQDASRTGDERTIEGSQIVEVGHAFLELRSAGPMPAMIPYHRILRIEVDGALAWRRAGTP